MSQLITNTARLGASLGVSILCGLLTAKVVAATLGPHGYGVFGLYGSVLAVLVLAGGLGTANALTRIGAGRVPHDAAGWRELRAAGFALTGAGWLIVSLGLVILRGPVGRAFLGRGLPLTSAFLLAGCLLFMLTINLENAILKTERQVPRLARADALIAVLGAAATVSLVHFYGVGGILPAMAVSAVAGGTTLVWMGERTRWGDMFHVASWKRVGCAMRSLLRLGATYGLSAVAASSVRVVIPFLILHRLGTSAVGLFTTAMTVAGIYLGAIISIMARDYFPRLAALPPTDRDALNDAVRDQQELALLLGMPAILAVLAFAPLVIPVIYSPRFLAAVPLLNWLVTADLFRLLAWTLAYVALARGSGTRFLRLELSSGALGLAAIAAGLVMDGLVGVGVGYLVAQAIYLVMAYRAARHAAGIGLASRIRWYGAVAIILLAGTNASIYWLPHPLDVGGAAAICLAAAAFAAVRVRRTWAFPGTTTGSDRDRAEAEFGTSTR